jgi:DNA-binding NtrC family response regulator
MNFGSFNILVVDDEIEYSAVLKKILSLKGYKVQTAKSGEDALIQLKLKKYDLVITDLMMEGINGIELLEKIKTLDSSIYVILVTGFGTVKNAVEAMKKGAFSYFIKGGDPEELILDVKKTYELKTLKKENTLLKLNNDVSKITLSSKNENFNKVILTALKAAKSNVSVLLLGESGVGKEVFARYIHNASDRNRSSFVAVNCHALQENMLESELFGHTKGAFTGAIENRVGRFEAADGGTLFLDEIADTPVSTQIKLLRVLENKQVERIGSNQTIDIDFRIVTATNKNLFDLISSGAFREDFYYRISPIIIEIPPLRERREDILDLVNYFVDKSSIEMKKVIKRIEPEVIDYLKGYDYPGNIRELKNIIERLVALSDNGVIKFESIAPVMLTKKTNNFTSLKEARNAFEKEFIALSLEKNNFNMTNTSEELKITRRQLFNKVSEYNLK